QSAATTGLYTLSLHDALPILPDLEGGFGQGVDQDGGLVTVGVLLGAVVGVQDQDLTLTLDLHEPVEHGNHRGATDPGGDQDQGVYVLGDDYCPSRVLVDVCV